jgi:hypothetical protein
MGTRSTLVIQTRKNRLSQYAQYDGYESFGVYCLAMRCLFAWFSIEQVEDMFDHVQDAKMAYANGPAFVTSLCEKFGDVVEGMDSPYWLLRECQKNIFAILLSGYITNDGTFPQEFNTAIDFESGSITMSSCNGCQRALFSDLLSDKTMPVPDADAEPKAKAEAEAEAEAKTRAESLVRMLDEKDVAYFNELLVREGKRPVPVVEAVVGMLVLFFCHWCFLFPNF